MKSGSLEFIVRPAAGSFPPAKRSGTSLLLFLAVLLPLALSGCAAKRLKMDFTGFEKAYAETSNREVLLNLARLENRDPTYFFKIGQITSAYKMAASLTGNGSYSVASSNPLLGGPAGGGTPGMNYENDPIFTFIPVNDETNAQLLLKPVPAETFYILYQQGWRVDQLVRLMVDRIELTRVTGQKCTVETIRNVPPAINSKPDSASDADYLRDPETLSSYVTFLRTSAVVYWLQKHGYLLLRGSNSFVAYNGNSGLDEAPKAQDVVSAAQKNAVWEQVGKKWLLGEKVFSPAFTLYPLHSDGTKLVPNIAQIEEEILSDPSMKELKQGPALKIILHSLSDGFAIEGSSDHQDSCNTTSQTKGVTAHLVMRSLIGLMAAAAQEQAPYDSLMHANPTIPNSRYITPEEQISTQLRFMEAVPAMERIPLLRLTGSSDESETQPIIQVAYRGKNYRIADEKDAQVMDNQYWNRDLFRLIGQLTSQVTVDISKFPLTEILQ
jgi:hypothetical protein